MPDKLDTGTWVTRIQGRPSSLCIRRCRLEVLAGPDAGLVRELAVKRIRVGARSRADLILTDSQVSGLHFEICLDETGYRVRDLGSTNGTFVGGYRVFDIGVPSGSIIELGETRIRFEPTADAIEVALWQDDEFGGLVGRSIAMRELFSRLARIAETAVSLVLTGETGTGKDAIAEAIHNVSTRRDRPFVVLDCGSIPANLIESEIFGHEKGAFTGATADYAGAFERATGGTVFLDEIGELPLELQPKLLRVLEHRTVRRLGSGTAIPVDVRVIAATNRNLEDEIDDSRFREDLYYRLAVARIDVPALRDRKEDIPLLVDHFLRTMPEGKTASLRRDTVELMMQHDWPGNVRELRNVVERAVLLREVPESAAALSRRGRRRRGNSAQSSSQAENPASGEGMLSLPFQPDLPLKEAKQQIIDEFERRYVKQLLERHEYNFSAAARAAGTNRMTIHKIAERLGLRRRGRSE